MNGRGFTVAELMLTVGLLGVLVLAYAALMPAGIRTGAHASRRQVATEIAQSVLERTRLAGYNNMTYEGLRQYGLIADVPQTSPFTLSTAGPATLNPSLVLPQGSGTIQVEDVSFDVRRVTVTIRWRDPNSPARSVVMATLVTNE